MKILDYMRKNKDWRTSLKEKPYCLKIEENDGLILLKYNQYDSDFSNSLVQECRGIIVREYNDDYQIVCYPFAKFFNYGEENCNFDDSQGYYIVTEKIDGSLIKVWFDCLDNKWRISTNGRIDAFTTLTDSGVSFGEAFVKALSYYGLEFDSFCRKLLKGYTYCFELVTPYNKILCDYDNKFAIYYLMSRDNYSGREYDDWGIFKNIVDVPERFEIFNFFDVYQMIKSLGENKEGFVVRDKNFNLVKVKTEWFINNFYKRCEKISIKNLIKVILDGEESEFLTYCPQYAVQLKELKEAMEEIELTSRRYAEETTDIPKQGLRAYFIRNSVPKMFWDYLYHSHEIKWNEYMKDENDWLRKIKEWHKND